MKTLPQQGRTDDALVKCRRVTNYASSSLEQGSVIFKTLFDANNRKITFLTRRMEGAYRAAKSAEVSSKVALLLREKWLIVCNDRKDGKLMIKN